MYSLTFDVTRSDMRQVTMCSDRFSDTQNLYDPVDLDRLPATGTGFTAEQCAVDSGVYTLDHMMLSEYWQMIIELCYTHYISE